MPEPDIMTWFPRREDYEETIVIQPDETLEEKIQRLNDSIELAQTNIKEIVDGNEVRTLSGHFRQLYCTYTH